MAALATHIYRRGARYWWRRALPHGLTGTRHSVEIRLTLRTHVPVTARWRGRLLDAVLDQTPAQIEDIDAKTGTLPRALIEKLVKDRPDPNRGKYGRSVYRFLKDYLTKFELYEPGRVNHSLRHTADTMLHNNDILESRIKEILRHNRADETSGRYNKGSKMRKIQEAIERIDYGIELVPRDARWEIAPAGVMGAAKPEDEKVVMFPRMTHAVPTER
jgi:integrase